MSLNKISIQTLFGIESTDLAGYGQQSTPTTVVDRPRKSRL
jgi:hypothetical protein